MISEESLRKTIDSCWAGQTVHCYDVVDSTNDEAKRLACQGAEHGALVVAELQLAGKGRQGRRFESPAQQGIWMSLVIKDQIEPMNASMITLVMGLAAAKAIEMETDLKPQIKWPNDLILNGKKVCGILTEMSLQGNHIHHIVVGIGINVGNEDFPEDIQSVATSIYLEGGQKPQRENLIAKILCQFEEYYAIFMKTQDLSNLVDTYNECLINRGKPVKVLGAKDAYTGYAKGINKEGELIVETDGQVRLVSTGEVSVRGVLGYV